MPAMDKNKPVIIKLVMEFSFLGLECTGVLKEKENVWKLTAYTRNVKLQDVLDKYCREHHIQPIQLPKELEGIDIEVEKLLFYMDTRGDAGFEGRVELEHKKLGGDLGEFGLIDSLTLDFSLAVIEKEFSSARIRVAGEIRKKLLPEIQCKQFDLIFEYRKDQGQGNWILKGHIHLKVFDLPSVEFFAGYAGKKDSQTLQLAANFSTDRGEIKIDDFKEIDGVSAGEIFNLLIHKNYIAEKEPGQKYFLTDKFQPFHENFRLDLDETYRVYEKSIRKVLQKTKPLIHIPGVVSIDIKGITLSIIRARSSGTKWDFSSKGDFCLHDLITGGTLINIEDGRLGFSGDTGSSSWKLEFAARDARFKSPRLKYEQVVGDTNIERALGFDLIFNKIIIEKSHGWSFESTVGFYIQDIPSPLDNVFPKEPIPGDFWIKRVNNTWDVYAGIKDNILEIPIPDIGKLINESHQNDGAPMLPEIGEGIAGLYGIGINLNNGLSLDLDLGVGLPSKLNELIGLKPHQIIRTYDRTQKSILKLKLSIGTSEFSSVLLSSPFQDIKGISDTTRDGKEWLELDFDKIFSTGKEDLGLIRVQKPELALNTDSPSFKASGGYEIDEKRKIKIPLFPIRKGLELLKLKNMAEGIPNGIPVKSIRFFDTVENELMIDEFKKALSWMGIKLPREFWVIIEEVADKVNHLPDRFKDYLSINIPSGLTFSVEISGDGSVSLDLKVDKNGDPLQLLLPMPPNPQLMGVRLYRLAFGTALSNSVLKLEINGEFDNFDLFSLAGAVLLSEIPEGTFENLLPETSKFQNTLIIRDLVTLIIYQTEIPIPIPLFYKKLEAVYYNLDDFKLHTAISFPQPKINIGELLNRINDLKDFFTKPYKKGVYVDGTEQGLLPLIHYGEKLNADPYDPGSQTDISFYMGPFYIRLPKYLDTEPATYYELTEAGYKKLEKEKSITNLKKLISLLRQRVLTKQGFEYEVKHRIEENEEEREDIIGKNEEELAAIVKACEHKDVPMGQLIGTPRYFKLFSGWDLVYLILNSGKKLSINYAIQYFNIHDRIGEFKLHFFKLFEFHVSWLLTTPYEFANKRFLTKQAISGLGLKEDEVWQALLETGYIEKSGGVTDMFLDLKDVSAMDLDEGVLNGKNAEVYGSLKNAPTVYDTFIKRAGKGQVAAAPASPADELLALLADNDTGEVVSADDEGLAIFLRGGLDIGKGAVIMESAVGLSANAVTGFRTGVSFYGRVVDVLDVRLLGFVKISPKSKKETFKLLGKSSLTVFNREIMAGMFDLAAGNEGHLSVSGKLELFPPDWPIQLNGHLSGWIDKERFQLDADAGFELGPVKAMAGLHIMAENKKSELCAKVRFLNSSLDIVYLSQVKGAGASMLLDVRMNAFNIIRFHSNLSVLFHLKAGVKLNGMSSLDIDIPLPAKKGRKPVVLKAVRIETLLNGNFDPRQGFLGIGAELTGNSFVLSDKCRISGGFAFYLWFKDDKARNIIAGDFVLSVGGYHPDFKRPGHYPVVTPLAIDWKVAPAISITGSAYFTVTPSCIMAGGELRAVWRKGGLKAWFTAHAHFILAWQPFYYQADLRVNVGVSYTFKKFGIRKKLSFHLGADLELWGPDLTGRAKIHLRVISFTIAFGSARKSIPEKVGTWAEFRTKFLPQSDLCGLVPMDGVEGETEKGEWVIHPHDFCLRTSSAVPINRSKLGKEETGYKSDFGVAPMGLGKEEFVSEKVIHISRVNQKGGKEVLDPAGSDFKFTPIKSNLPRAMWGNPSGPELNPGSALVKDSVTGFDIKARDPNKLQGKSTGYSLDTLRKSGPINDAFAWLNVPRQKKKSISGRDAREAIRRTIAGTRPGRKEIIEAVGYDGSGFSVKKLGDSTEDAFLFSPEIWDL